MPEKLKKRIYDEPSKEKNGDYQDLVEHCLELYDDIDSSEYREAKIKEIIESHKRYEQKEEKTSDPWPGASNMVLPLTTISIDNLEPRMVSGMVGREPYVRFVEDSEDEQSEQTKSIQSWYHDELKYGVKLEHEAGAMAHNLMLEGTVFPICAYDRKEETVIDYFYPTTPEEIDQAVENRYVLDQVSGVWIGQDGAVTSERNQVLYEGGSIDYVPFTDLFIPDDAEDWENTPVIRKVRPTYAELERAVDKKPGYFNIGPWILKETHDSKTDSEQSPAQSIDGVKVTGKETIECIECILSYVYRAEDEDEEDIKNWNEEKYVVQIALERQIIIRFVKLRDLNWKNQHYIKRIRLFPEKGKAYGTSIYGKIKSVQDGASKTFNHAINIAEVILVPWFFYSNKAGLQGDVTLYPGAGIQIDDIQSILFPNFNINPQQWIDYIYLWTQFWERLVSIGDLQVGRQSEKKRTATESLAVIQEGNVKHNYQSQTFREEFLQVLRCLYDLYYQHMPLNKTFMYMGQTIPIRRQDMARNYSFRLTGSTERSNKLIERKENEDLAGIIANVFPTVANPVKPFEEILRSYGHTDVKDWIDPFMAKINILIRENPQIKPAIDQFITESMQQAEVMEQAAKEGIE